MLRLSELEMAGRGGVRFALPDGRQLHLGVEGPFRPNKKAHPAFLGADLDRLALVLEEEGYAVEWDDTLAPRPRFHGEDPFGNRIELPKA